MHGAARRFVLLLAVATAFAGSPVLVAEAADEEAALPPQEQAIPPVRHGEEIASMRTAASRTFEDDGGFRTELYGERVHYRDADGAFVPIDTTLVRRGAAWTMRANDADVALPLDLRDPVTVSSGGAWARFALRGARGAPTVAGSRATYADALPGVAVAYEAKAGSLKETLTLASASAPRAFTFAVSLSPGLSVVQRGNGAAVIDDVGTVVFEVPPPFMDDAAGAHSDAVALTVTPSLLGGWTLTLRADDAWLDDPGRAWPVVVDPHTSWTPNPDCFVSSNLPTTAQCTGTSFNVGWDGTNKHRALLQFPDIHTVVPPDAVVLDTILKVTMLSTTTGMSVAMKSFRLTPRTFTTGVTWNTYDGINAWAVPGGDFGSTVYGSVNVGVAGAPELYPRDLAAGWVDESMTNRGLLLKTDEATSNVVTFASSEHATSTSRPTFTIKWDQRLGLQDSMRYDTFRLGDRSTVHVNLANGNGIVEERDISVQGTGIPNAVSRYLNNEYGDDQDLGLNWTTDAGGSVELNVFGSRGIEFRGPSNYLVLFKQTGTNQWESPPGLNAKLEKDLDGVGTYRITWNESKHKMVFKNFAGSKHELWKQVDRNNNTVTYNYDANGEWDSITDTQGRTVTVNHDNNGYLTSFQDQAGRTWTYAYDNTSGIKRMASYTNPENQRTDYAYTGSGDIQRVTNVTDNRSVRLTYTGGKVKTVTQVTDNAADTGPTTTYDYDLNWLSAAQSSIEVTTLAESGWTQGNALAAAPSTAQAADGTKSLAVTSPGGTVTLETNHATVPAKADARYTGALSSRAATTGRSVSARLRWIDTSGALISTTAGSAATDTTTGWTTVTVTGVAPTNTAFVSLQVRYTSTAASEIHYVDKAGVATGRSTTWMLGNSRTLPEKCKGLFANRVTNGRGNATINCYDTRDRVQASMDALGHVDNTEYDGGNSTGNDNPTKFTNALSAAFSLTYNNNNALTETVAPESAAGQSPAKTSFHYPSSGLVHQPDSRTDPQSKCRSFGYDSVGNLTDVYDGLTPNAGGDCAGQTGTVHFKNDYNANGTLEWQRAPGGDCLAATPVRCTKYTYTYAAATPGPPVLQRIVIDNPTPLGDETTDFDSSNRPVTMTDGRGKVTRLTYDKLDRITQVLYDNATTCTSTTTCTTYAYDGDGNMTQRVDNTGTTTFTYDRARRVTKKAQPLTAADCAGQGGITFTWDDAHNLKTMCDAGGTVTYQYNEVEKACWLLVGTSANTCASAPAGAVTFGYDDADRRTTTTYPTTPATTMTAEYLPSGQVKVMKATKATTPSATTIYHLAYSYSVGTSDTLLRRTVSDQASTVLTSYGYDASNRLCWVLNASGSGTCAAPPTGAERFVHDDNGNRTSRTVGGVTTNYTFNQANQLTGGSPTTPAYDGAGNETTGPDGRTAAYNAKGQTSSVDPAGAPPALAMTYADADSTERTAAGTTSFSTTPLGIDLTRTGTANTYYVRDPEGLLVAQRVPAGSTYYYLFDGLGSVRHLVDSAAATVATYTYDAWGGTTASGTAAAGNPFRFASGHLDSTGLYKFGTRYYDAAYGRWTQRDPIAGRISDPGTVNRYVYAGCDPVNNVDPTGRVHNTAECRALNVASAVTTAVSVASLIVPVALPVTIASTAFSVISTVGAIKAGCYASDPGEESDSFWETWG